MPTIECTIRREGDTILFLQGTQYTFTPVPGYAKDFPTYSLCTINKAEHVEYLLARKQFRTYIAERSRNELKPETNPMQGFRIVKKEDGTGYLAADYRDQNHPHFCGEDGTWRDLHSGSKAFRGELEAFEFLRSEVEMILAEEKESGKGPVEVAPSPAPVTTFECCGRTFKNQRALDSHRRITHCQER